MLDNEIWETPGKMVLATLLSRSLLSTSRLPFSGGIMTSKLKPEVRRIGREQFPRWVIIDDATKVRTEQRFWNGRGWEKGLRNAMLFAHRSVVLAELARAKGE